MKYNFIQHITMNELEDKLRNIDWSCLQNSFSSIAKTLMGKYIIKKGNARYRIVEIEFYAFSNSQKDYITYPRATDAGQWFFHQSGVDLTFDSHDVRVLHKNRKLSFSLDAEPQFGGILIRGLYKLTPKEEEDPYIFGPQKCVNELWDRFNALAPSADEYPAIIRASREDNLSIHNLRCCKRCINIKDEDRDHKIMEWIIRLGLGGKVTIDEIKDEIKEYKTEMFENEQTQLYRYFNLPLGEDPCSFKIISSSSRPKKSWFVE